MLYKGIICAYAPERNKKSAFNNQCTHTLAHAFYLCIHKKYRVCVWWFP